MKRYFVIAALLVAGVMLAACSSSGGELVVTDAWGRTSPAVADNGAFYMTITNNTNQDDELLSASVDVCTSTELHEMYMKENDVMGMRPVPGGSIPIPAGETVELKVGGMHVMCLGKSAEFTPGDTYDITLTFAKAGEMVVTADIRDSADMPMNMDMNMEEGSDMNMQGDN
ncbi:MAG: copper chaperone PCu(A)C [Candidatus Thermofonsia bacterium]|nr:MAG: copper chaperone PCu(A)C [Candidatus Thermofonsia bacterium]